MKHPRKAVNTGHTMTPETKTDSVVAEAAVAEAPVKRPVYWRHFDEYARGEQIDEFVHREFPGEVNELLDPVSRRNFFKVMGASMMLAGLAGCARQPEEKIVPYVKPPEEVVAGKPSYYATAMALGGYGIGLLATSYEGRPTKLEGLPEHPSSLGSTDAWSQASILDMYDPDRLDSVNYTGQISTWAKFVKDTTTKLAELDAVEGAGLAILTETVTSPTLAWQINKLLARYPKAHWYQWDGLGGDNARRGSIMAFGSIVNTIYDFTKAKTILSLDADFLSEGPGRVRYSRDFAASRDFESNGGTMSRLYCVESTPTLTGAAADHKIGVRYLEVETIARAIATRIGVPNAGPSEAIGSTGTWLEAVVEDLQSSGGAVVVVAGEQQPAVVHALAHAINEKLGAVGAGTVKYTEPIEQNPVIQIDSITELTGEMVKGNVKLLVMLGGNPVYTLPGDAHFKEALEGLGGEHLIVHLTPSTNETTHYSHWAIPEAHFLEGWSDVRGHDGTVSLIQPLIQPLYNGKTAHEVMSILLGNDTSTAYDLLRESWMAQVGPVNFDDFWRDALGKGVVAGREAAAKSLQHTFQFPPAPEVKRNGLDVLFRLDENILDGRFANNGWLQELPHPLSRLTWDNALVMHPDTAKANRLMHEDVAELTIGNQTVTGPVLIQFGHPKDVVTIRLGYGRTYCGAVGKGVGFDVAVLRTAKDAWFAMGGSLKNTGKSYELARTEEHWNIEQSLKEQAAVAETRHLIRESSLARFKEQPELFQHMGHPAPEVDNTLYDPVEKDWNIDHKWAMTIDLNKCSGCGVCSIACQAENNIAVVGKDQVRMGREMHWIRVDRYYKGDFDGDVEVVHQPLPCMQCENAPCEPVCPVGATQHSREGLNDMAYNRCIGTRYCLNNCPYKVRRFNFYKYSDHTTPQLKMMRNPNVTVRSRGVIEKCTYCVQRINIARIDAKRDGNGIIADGTVVPACQQACPSNAIAFGNMKDENSQVSKNRESKRNYGLLADIGTRPRTTYLARLRNTSPKLAKNEAPSEGHH
jgi:MoCo/4Fe-4S cofactor protein with predicted Tat translocation signal